MDVLTVLKPRTMSRIGSGVIILARLLGYHGPPATQQFTRKPKRQVAAG
jgi:hypothetical protein